MADAAARIFGAFISVGAAPRDHRGNRLDDDRDVEPDRPVLEVGEIEAHEVVEGEPGAPRDLPETGHPREDSVTLTVPVLEQPVVAEWKRPRADEAHLSLEHVDDTGDSVERE